MLNIYNYWYILLTKICITTWSFYKNSLRLIIHQVGTLPRPKMHGSGGDDSGGDGGY